ncbi:MAG: hypothetical protein GY768_14360 [Planctomycetaceae bacterium]|nr:hypothetical protein [Planctomycetaceae bacterium]
MNDAPTIGSNLVDANRIEVASDLQLKRCDPPDDLPPDDHAACANNRKRYRSFSGINWRPKSPPHHETENGRFFLNESID